MNSTVDWLAQGLNLPSERNGKLTLCISKSQTALEKRPAATRYKKQVEIIKKVWIGAKLPPLYPISYLPFNSQAVLRLTCR